MINSSNNTIKFEENYNQEQFSSKDQSKEETNSEREDDIIFPNRYYLDITQFRKGVKIGSGASGDVYKVINIKTKELNAAKVSKTLFDKDTKDIKKMIYFKREIFISSKVSHPAIIRFIGFSPIDFTGVKKPVIFTNYLENNSLEHILELERHNYDIPQWNDTAKLKNIIGIASGMAHLFTMNIIHRDLKPQNILLNEYLHPIITDFGFSKIEGEKEYEKIVGTHGFIAPEVYNSPYNYSDKSDVYSFAILLYEMFEQKVPFEHFTPANVCYHICIKKLRLPFTEKTPRRYRKLIEECWNEDPSKRPSFKKISEHLKNDIHSFLTDENDIQHFNHYVQFIEQNENQSSTSLKTKIIENKFFKKCSLHQLYKEYYEDFYDYESDGFISINDYEESSQISRDEYSSFCDVVDKISGKKYSAKISNVSIENFTKNEIQNISKEVEILSKLKHPLIQEFHGFSFYDFSHHLNPVIIHEHSSKTITLFDILENERKGQINKKWTDTKKLINVYGIALGMSYLHSQNIILNNLNPKSILIDDVSYHPKIANIGFYTQVENSKSVSCSSYKRIKESVLYSAPEILYSHEKIKANDVYSFALIVYEMFANRIPYKNVDDLSLLISKIVNRKSGISLDQSIPLAYRQLIMDCTETNPKLRPSFDEIVNKLKTEPEFITQSIDKNEFLKFIKSIQ